MKRSMIAAQLYTLRDFAKTAEDLEQTLKKVKEIGYDSVQVSGIGPIAPEQVKSLCDKNGLTICATHTSFDRLEDHLDEVIAENRLYDNRYVGLGSMPSQYRTSEEGYRTFAGKAVDIARKLEQAGLQFIYHNHHFEFERFSGKTGMDLLFESSDPSVFGFELDTYWVQSGGASPLEWIRKVKGRMKVVHFKDFGVVANEQVMAEIGEGNLNWAELIPACRETGVEWYVVEQDVCRRDPFESLAMSYRFLQQFAD